MPQNIFTTVVIHQLSQPWCSTFASDYFLQTTQGWKFFTMSKLGLEFGVIQRIPNKSNNDNYLRKKLWRSFNLILPLLSLSGPWFSPSLHAVGFHGYYGVGERLNKNRARLNITKLLINVPQIAASIWLSFRVLKSVSSVHFFPVSLFLLWKSEC